MIDTSANQAVEASRRTAYGDRQAVASYPAARDLLESAPDGAAKRDMLSEVQSSRQTTHWHGRGVSG